MSGALREALRRRPELWGKSRTDADVLISSVEPVDTASAERCRERWNGLCKPLYALGRLEDMIVRLAAAERLCVPKLSPRAVFLFAADNGIVEEGVSQTGQEVTAQVLRNMENGKTGVCLFAHKTNTELIALDLGTRFFTKPSDVILDYKLMPQGTHNFLREAAMSEEEMLAAFFSGVHCAETAAELGYSLLAGGEMGIGNTSTATALIAALTDTPAEKVTGRGAGLSDQGLELKRRVLHEAVAGHQAEGLDTLGWLAAVGGLDIAALCGLYLGAAKHHIPVLLDGLISYAAALTACRLCPAVTDYLIPVHIPREQASALAAEALDLHGVLDLSLALGEGAGALLLLPLLETALYEYCEMPLFEEGKVERYHDFTRRP